MSLVYEDFAGHQELAAAPPRSGCSVPFSLFENLLQSPRFLQPTAAEARRRQQGGVRIDF